jgi:hypothetical protein
VLDRVLEKIVVVERQESDEVLAGTGDVVHVEERGIQRGVLIAKLAPDIRQCLTQYRRKDLLQPLREVLVAL